jgi:hypothetical protein
MYLVTLTAAVRCKRVPVACACYTYSSLADMGSLVFVIVALFCRWLLSEHGDVQ